MRRLHLTFAVGAVLAVASAAEAQVVGRVGSVAQSHMCGGGGVARDAIARQYDVDADSVKLEIDKGLVTFGAKKGRLVDLDKLHESIWATRLSGKTGMSLDWIDVT